MNDINKNDANDKRYFYCDVFLESDKAESFYFEADKCLFQCKVICTYVGRYGV